MKKRFMLSQSVVTVGTLCRSMADCQLQPSASQPLWRWNDPILLSWMSAKSIILFLIANTFLFLFLITKMEAQKALFQFNPNFNQKISLQIRCFKIFLQYWKEVYSSTYLLKSLQRSHVDIKNRRTMDSEQELNRDNGN